MPDTSWWIGLNRETFHAVAYDEERLARLRNNKSYAMAGWGDDSVDSPRSFNRVELSREIGNRRSLGKKRRLGFRML